MMPVVEGPRGCRPGELADVIGLVDAAMRRGSDQTMLTDYPLVYAPANLPNVQVVSVDGRPIATAPVLPRRVEGDGFRFGLGVISPTATDPPFQHRGHGSACVAACVGRMEALGLELSVLWTLVATFPFYERNGWQAVERYGGWVRLTGDDATRFPRWATPVVRLADAPGALAELLALHDLCGPRVTRSSDEGVALWSLPKMTTWLARTGSRVAGYLVSSTATNKPGILEAAGDPEALAGLIRHVLDASGAEAAVEVAVGFAPDALAAAVMRAIPERAVTPSRGDMMVRLNDPVAFARSIRGWLEARAGSDRRSVSVGVVDAGVTVAFEWSGASLAIGTGRLPEHVDLTRRELTSVLFGPHPDRPVLPPSALRWVPPFHLPIPVLDRS